jgi:hypothetical protein
MIVVPDSDVVGAEVGKIVVVDEPAFEVERPSEVVVHS